MNFTTTSIIAMFLLCGMMGETLQTSDVSWSNHYAGFISHLLKIMKWDTLNIIYDVDPAAVPLIDGLLYAFDEAMIKTAVYQINSSNFQNYLLQIHSAYFPKIQVLYVTANDAEMVSRVMNTVNGFDFRSNRSTDFRIQSKWMLMTYASVVETLIDVLHDLCHVSVITLTQQTNACFNINTLEKKKARIVWTPITTMSREDDIFPNLKYHFNGRQLLIGTLPFQLTQRRTVNGKVVYYGKMIDMLNEMAGVLNFTYILQEPKDGKWGVKTGNNTWNGLTGELQRHEIDILYAEYLINAERSEVIDFILPALITMPLGILYRTSNLNHSWTWLSILKPLSINVYVVTIVTYVLFCILFIIVDHYSVPKFLNRQQKEKIQISEALLYMFGCLCLEGGHMDPRTTKGRLLYSSWWVFCVLIGTVYTANLTSSILVKDTKRPFTNLKELSQQTAFKYGLLEESAIQDMFAKSAIKENQDIWSGISKFRVSDPSVVSRDIDALLNKVVTSDFALIDVFPNTNQFNACTISLLKAKDQTHLMSFAVPLNSPSKSVFERYISSLFEMGAIQRDITESHAEKNCTEDTEVHALSLDNIKGAFGALGIGMLVACAGLFVERLIKFIKATFCNARKNTLS